MKMKMKMKVKMKVKRWLLEYRQSHQGRWLVEEVRFHGPWKVVGTENVDEVDIEMMVEYVVVEYVVEYVVV